MDAEQQADLAAALAEVGHPASPAQEPTSQEVVKEVQTREQPTAAPPPAPPLAPPVAPPQAQQPQTPRHQALLQGMMEKARQEREKQEAARKQQEYERTQNEYRRLLEARQYGEDAFLKAAGIEPKKREPTLADIFGPDKPEDKEPPHVSELKNRVEQLDQYIKRLEAERNQERSTIEQQQQQYYMQQEISDIDKFISDNTEKYQFVSAARPMGSAKDLYNGKISMYNQGYSPSNEDMTELVEARIEEVLKLVLPTQKGRKLVEELLGVSIPSSTESKTLTSAGDTPAVLAKDLPLTDEENQQLALKEAYAAREAILKQMGKTP